MEIQKMMRRFFKSQRKETVIHVKMGQCDKNQAEDDEVLQEFLKFCGNEQEKRAARQKNVE